ncbi:MAG: serine hydrolase [Steroidobacteraceae bacterium]
MKAITSLVLAATLAVPAHPASNAIADQIRTIIGNNRGLDGPGCVIGVLKGGKEFLVVADGAADIAAKKPLDADTQIYTASVAKQFTALAIAQLVVTKKIGLDDDIRKYLPEMPQYRSVVTVAMLLHHTSGIRDMLYLGTYAGYETSAGVSRADALQLVSSQSDTVFVPGTQHRYSNSGYLLLSEIVARVSGVSFADYMQKKVFAPMGMSRTRVLAGARSGDANAAHGYVPDGAGFRLADTHPFYGGAGGAVTTISDLAKYDYDINVAHVVWTPAIAKIMLAPGKLADGTPAARDDRTYAGGLSLNGPWIQHGGAGEGFKNMVAWLPGGELSVHVLCNNGAVVPSAVAEQVVDALGGYPTLRPATPAFAGRYASDALPVIYTLTPNGEARVILEIAPRPGGPGHRRVVELSKGPDGSFTAKGFHILLDTDQHGFLLGQDRDRAGLLHFDRID